MNTDRNSELTIGNCKTVYDIGLYVEQSMQKMVLT